MDAGLPSELVRASPAAWRRGVVQIQPARMEQSGLLIVMSQSYSRCKVDMECVMIDGDNLIVEDGAYMNGRVSPRSVMCAMARS